MLMICKMMSDKDGRDTYIHLLCHTKKIGKEIKRVVNLGFEKWKPQILDR